MRLRSGPISVQPARRKAVIVFGFPRYAAIGEDRFARGHSSQPELACKNPPTGLLRLHGAAGRLGAGRLRPRLFGAGSLGLGLGPGLGLGLPLRLDRMSPSLNMSTTVDRLCACSKQHDGMGLYSVTQVTKHPCNTMPYATHTKCRRMLGSHMISRHHGNKVRS